MQADTGTESLPGGGGQVSSPSLGVARVGGGGADGLGGDRVVKGCWWEEIKSLGRGEGSAQTDQPGAARGPETGEGGGCGQVNRAHAAPTRPGRRPRSYSVSGHRGPQPPPSPRVPGPPHPGRASPPAPGQVAHTAPLTNCPNRTCTAGRAETPTPPSPPPPPPDVTSGRAGLGGTPRRSRSLPPAPGGGTT